MQDIPHIVSNMAESWDATNIACTPSVRPEPSMQERYPHKIFSTEQGSARGQERTSISSINNIIREEGPAQIPGAGQTGQEHMES